MRTFIRGVNYWLSIIAFFLCFSILLTIFSQNSNIMLLRALTNSDSFRESGNTERKKYNEYYLPLCVEDLLEQGNFRYREWAQSSYNSSRLIPKLPDGHACKLMQYTVKDAVSCFDNLYFKQLIPDYDRMTQPLEIPRNAVPFLHGDVDVDSSILGLRVSFKWRPIINYTVIETIRQWGQADVPRPDLLFLSMEVHHMLRSNGADFQLYWKSIAEMGPILNQLAKLSNVIWLNQYPTVDLYGNTNAHNTYIHTEKIHHYNKAVDLTFKNYSYIRIWDSSNALAEEYVRGCSTYHRQIPRDVFVKEGPSPFINCKSYVNCEDYIHTGFVALSEASQLLYNDICNAFL